MSTQLRSTAAPDLTLLPAPRNARAHAMAGKHALLVGINYSPEPTGIAPYTTGMAEHLAQFAGSVTVLTGVPHYPHWTLDEEYRYRLRTQDPSKGSTRTPRVKRLRHYVPATQSAVKRAGYEATFLLNAVTSRVSLRPDIVIAVTPSLGGAVAGARLAKRHGSRLLVVVQDLMAKATQQSGISGGDAVTRITAGLERYAVSRADRVAVVSDAFREQLHEYGVADDKISVLPNWTHIDAVDLSQQEARAHLGWAEEPFTVVHTGNIGLKQDLGNLVEAARLTAWDPSVEFIVVGDGSQRAAVEAQAAGLANLRFVDPLDEVQYPKSLAAADLLVVNERPGVGDMSLPSKLTSYLSAGRPVLAAVAPDGATSKELRRTSGAARLVAPGDPAAFAATIFELKDDARRLSRMGAAGARYAARQLGPEAAKSRLDALIEEVLS